MWRIAFVLITTLLGISAASVDAATLYVANNGIDSDTCGAKNAPCRSVSRAIVNAAVGDTIVVGPGRYGDLNGDGNFGGPGEEAGPAGCQCMIEVNKRLTLQSSDGAGSTILDASNAEVTGIVVLADGATFGGGSGHGFTIVNARHAGLFVEGNGVTAAGNVAIRNGLSGSVAIAVVGTGIIVADNAAIDNANVGIQVNGDGTVTGNVASANLEGFRINSTGPVQFTQNVAIGNRTLGFSGHSGVFEIRRNSFLGNGGPGITLTTGTNTPIVADITDNNIFENGSCGLQNNTGALVTASGNFWGPDLADAVCDPSSNTIVEPVATKPFNINVKIGL